MIGSLAGLLRQNTRRNPKRSTRPVLEGLEDRMLLYATNGGLWSFPARVTYSFVPDGTSVGGMSSNLFSPLNGVASTATWEAAFQKAAAIWSSYANINIAQVSDNGAALGTSGNQQDDSRFGDIRIAMIPQFSGVLAYTMLPPPLSGGTNAGDIVFNSNIPWRINNDYDVETVALHEMGHALGLDHSCLTNAVMYACYDGQKQSLTADDVSGIQSLYGAYPNDADTNRSFATSTNITGLVNGNSQIVLPGLNLAGTTDYDYFVVTVPSSTTGTMTVTMQSANLSSVSPRLSIYNSAQTLIATNSMANSFGATDTIQLNGVSAGQVYYIKCSAASTLGSFGAYGLLANFGSSSQAPIAPPNTVVAGQPDRGGGSENILTLDTTLAGVTVAAINPVENNYATPTDLTLLESFYQTYSLNGQGQTQNVGGSVAAPVPVNADALAVDPTWSSTHFQTKSHNHHHHGGPLWALPSKDVKVVVNLDPPSHGRHGFTAAAIPSSPQAHDPALENWGGLGHTKWHPKSSRHGHHG
jgi:hypothetical protein